MNINKRRNGFTVVEVSLVIVIVGIIASVVTAGYSKTAARARDTLRISDLKALQEAVEMYHAKNGKYPQPSRGYGNWSGECSNYDPESPTPPVPYILGIANYLPKQPLDPRWNRNGGELHGSKCYLYKSNASGTKPDGTAYPEGADYMILAHQTMEAICGGDPGNTCNTPEIQSLDRISYTQPTIALYSDGAKNW